MKVAGRTAIVTGGGGGIGGALAAHLVQEGARVLVADLDGDRAAAVAATIEVDHPGAAIHVGANVADDAALAAMVDQATAAFGPVDLFFANAGIGEGLGLDSTEQEWARSIDVNVMAHVRAARLLVPGWIERGEGYFVSTASAAGLLTQIGSAPYSVTKHAAVAFSEWLSVTYGDRGVRVSCLCPMGVNTNMLNAGMESQDGKGQLGARAVLEAGDVLEPTDVAAAVLAAVDEERFLVLPHAEVLEFFQRKGRDYDRWLRGMRRLQATVS